MRVRRCGSSRRRLRRSDSAKNFCSERITQYHSGIFLHPLGHLGGFGAMSSCLLSFVHIPAEGVSSPRFRTRRLGAACPSGFIYASRTSTCPLHPVASLVPSIVHTIIEPCYLGEGHMNAGCSMRRKLVCSRGFPPSQMDGGHIVFYKRKERPYLSSMLGIECIRVYTTLRWWSGREDVPRTLSLYVFLTPTLYIPSLGATTLFKVADEKDLLRTWTTKVQTRLERTSLSGIKRR